MIVQYVKDKKGNRIGCVVALKFPLADGYYIGWSACCPQDTFDREEAIKKAIGRAKHAHAHYRLGNYYEQNNYWYRKNPGDHFEDCNNRRIPNRVIEVIKRVDKRAQRYFK